MDGVNQSGADVSALLQAWSQGHVDARDRLMEVVYQELRRRAAADLRRERPGHTLQQTALVHEACLRLVVKFFRGFTLQEIGHVLGLSVATVEREWKVARAWLYPRLKGKSSRRGI